MSECKCRYDLAYHAEFNPSRGHKDDRCHNEADPDAGLCTPCLFGCAP